MRGRPCDMMVLPEENHLFTGASERYSLEGIKHYFVEHLKP
jgi:hypothetical protein